MNTFKLEIITPESVVFSGVVSKVSVPSSLGRLGILPHHAHLFATLTEGEVVITDQTKPVSLAIGGGFIQVNDFETTILVSRAVHADQLDEQLVTQAIEQAKKDLMANPMGESYAATTALLRQSLADLRILRRLHHRIVS